MHNVPPDVDFESSRSPAKSESWTSGRSVYRQGSILLIWRRRSRSFSRGCPHGRTSASQRTDRVWKRRRRRRRETRRKTERRHTQQTNRTPRLAWRWNDARLQTPEPWHVLNHAVSMHKIRRVQCVWETWRVKCICLHTPSVTSDRHRL